MDLVAHLKENPFVLAPMAAITDCPFRTFMKEMGAGIVITELISAHGLIYGSQKTLDLMKFDPIQRPFGVQIFGDEQEILAKGAQIAEKGGADFIDINLGCPVNKVTKKGGGAAMLRDPKALGKVLAFVKSQIEIPLTIKIRTGWDSETINAKEVVQVASDAGVTWVAIHGRTRSQGYSGQADWDLIGEVKATAPIPIIGNGDILTAEKAVNRLKETGCDGVMIGRGSLKNPWIFRQAKELLQKSQESSENRDFCSALDRLKLLVDGHGDSRRATLQMKKFIGWFSAGYPGSQNFRKSLFGQTSASDIMTVSREFFSQISLKDQHDTSGDGFLMGGHG